MTLLEIMIVIAIIGVISAMAAVTAQRLGTRNATQNAASEVGTRLQQARSLSELRGSNVVVMVYPTYRKNPASLTGGTGAMFVIEDVNGDWMTSTGACDGTGTTDCGWTNFEPVTNKIVPTTATKDKIVARIYFDDFSSKNVKFANATATSGTWPAPFSALDDAAITSGCSFCSSNKGAVIFTGEGGLQMLDGTGAQVAARVGALTLSPAAGGSLANSFRYGLVSATGLVTLVK